MTYSEIVAKVYLYTKTNSTSLPSDTLVILANNALERVTSLILQSDGRWEWDDTNQTDLPIGVTALVANQQDYSFSVNFLEILRLELKDANGNWNKLTPFDMTDLRYESLTDFLKTAGTPRYYEKLGSSVFLYPPPSYSQANSLKVYFQRPPSYFVAGDTTKQPGFSALYHDLIPLWASYDFAVANGLTNANQIMASIQMKEAALAEDYANRGADEPLRIVPVRRRSSR